MGTRVGLKAMRTKLTALKGISFVLILSFAVFRTFGNSAFDSLPQVPVTETEMATIDGPGQSADYAARVLVSSSGRIYVMGQSVDVGLQNYLFVRCYKPDGTLLWQDQRDINGFVAQDLVVDAQDNAYAVGMVFSNGGLSPSQDVGIMKYDANGVPARDSVYALDFIEPLINPFFNENRPTAVALAPNGKLYISGFVTDGDFARPTIVAHPVLMAVDPAGKMSLDWSSYTHEATTTVPIAQETPVAIAVNAASDVYEVSNWGSQGNGVTLRKVTANGENAWRESSMIDAFKDRHHQAVTVGVDGSGNPYVIGNVAVGDSGNEIFVAKFNPPDGALLRLNTFSFAEVSEVQAAKVLSDGSIVGAGSVDRSFEWTIFRIDPQGVLQWEQRYDLETARNLTVDAAGNIYVVGEVPGDLPRTAAVVKLGPSGQILWSKYLSNTEGLPEEPARFSTIAVDSKGTAYVAAHRDVGQSASDEGQSYPVYDAVLFKLQPLGFDAPSIRFVTPTEGALLQAGAPFPKVNLEASGPAGIQKIALYDRAYHLLAVLTNAPYEVSLGLTSDASLTPLYAVAYDNLGYASYVKVSTRMPGVPSIIELAQPSFRVSETESNARIVVKRTSAVGRASVNVTMTSGTATAADYNYANSQDPFTIYFEDGATTAEALITIEKDKLAEPDETFTLTLSSPDGGTLGATQNATVTIVDDDSGRPNPAGTFAFTSFAYNVTESGGAVDLTIARTDGSEGDVTLGYATQPDTATEAHDYLGTRGTVHFASGETSKTIRVYSLKDAEAESLESFYVSLEYPDNGAVLGPKWYTLVYIQDENGATSPATLSFDTGAISVAESGNALRLTVRRQGNGSAACSVSYSTENGTALAGNDYAATSGILNFGPQETLRTIEIPILADAAAEGNETFSIKLNAPQGATLGAYQTVTVTITDSGSAQSGETLNTWLQQTFTAQEQANPQISALFADPDKDGYPNAVEYALGLDPKMPNTGNLLKPEVTMVNGQPSLQVTLTRPKGRNDLDYLFEMFSAIGAPGCTECANLLVTDNGNGTETVKVRAPSSVTEKSVFLLLKVALK